MILIVAFASLHLLSGLQLKNQRDVPHVAYNGYVILRNLATFQWNISLQVFNLNILFSTSRICIHSGYGHHF